MPERPGVKDAVVKSLFLSVSPWFPQAAALQVKTTCRSQGLPEVYGVCPAASW